MRELQGENMLEDIYRSYRSLQEDVGREFSRVSDIFADRMQCRKGCSMCCSQLFGISLIEAAYISRAVKQLEPAARHDLRRKAREYLAELTGLPIDETADIEGHSRVVGPALEKLSGRHHIPCPALENDACTIYDHRPIIARKWGIPLWNPRKPNVLQACELNFAPGEAIDGTGLVEPQMELEYRWLEFKTRVHGELDLPDVVATVASAVLFDYEAVLEEAIANKA